MAPLSSSEFLTTLDSSSSSYPFEQQQQPRSSSPLVSSAVEFKPRVGTWASNDAWSLQQVSPQPEQQWKDNRRRRRVRFAAPSKNETRDYFHVHEYTAPEKQACWFQRSDYRAMRAHNTATVDSMTAGSHHRHCGGGDGGDGDDDDDMTEIGLETRTPSENAYCHQLIRTAILTVLDEQDDQWRFDGGLVQPEILAARYSSCTWEAQERARCLGQSQRLAAVAAAC